MQKQQKFTGNNPFNKSNSHSDEESTSDSESFEVKPIPVTCWKTAKTIDSQSQDELNPLIGWKTAAIRNSQSEDYAVTNKQTKRSPKKYPKNHSELSDESTEEFKPQPKPTLRKPSRNNTEISDDESTEYKYKPEQSSRKSSKNNSEISDDESKNNSEISDESIYHSYKPKQSSKRSSRKSSKNNSEISDDESKNNSEISDESIYHSYKPKQSSKRSSRNNSVDSNEESSEYIVPRSRKSIRVQSKKLLTNSEISDESTEESENVCEFGCCSKTINTSECCEQCTIELAELQMNNSVKQPTLLRKMIDRALVIKDGMESSEFIAGVGFMYGFTTTIVKLDKWEERMSPFTKLGFATLSGITHAFGSFCLAEGTQKIFPKTFKIGVTGYFASKMLEAMNDFRR